MTTAASQPVRGAIYGCPIAGNSYCESLYSAARRLGIDVREAVWSGRWLLENLHAGDTLHLHWPSFLYYKLESRWKTMVGLGRFVALCLMLRRRKVRIVWTAHNLYPHDGGKGEWSHRVARRLLVRIASRVFVHGPTPASIVSAEFDIRPERLCVIPHGNWIGTYPNAVSPSEARARLCLPQAAHVFLFIGLCKPYKGLESLIDAMTRQDPGAVLVIAGKFPSAAYQSHLTARVAAVDNDRISIHPRFVDDNDLQLFLNAADTVVLPYREILTSGAAVLAMSFGRPVVGPRLGSLIDLVGEDCGVLYDSEDPNALPRALAEARARHFSERTILERAAASTWEDAALALERSHQWVAASTGTDRAATARP